MRGRSAYTCVAAEIREYFEKLKTDYIGACYGSYFMEFADYYAQENMEAADLLNLLYVSLLALEKEAIPDERIRYAFEVRLMTMGGEFPADITQDGFPAASCQAGFLPYDHSTAGEALLLRGDGAGHAGNHHQAGSDPHTAGGQKLPKPGCIVKYAGGGCDAVLFRF